MEIYFGFQLKSKLAERDSDGSLESRSFRIISNLRNGQYTFDHFFQVKFRNINSNLSKIPYCCQELYAIFKSRAVKISINSPLSVSFPLFCRTIIFLIYS